MRVITPVVPGEAKKKDEYSPKGEVNLKVKLVPETAEGYFTYISFPPQHDTTSTGVRPPSDLPILNW